MREPDRVTEIKNALRSCKRIVDVNSVADQYREEVKAMHDDPKTRVFALQIINMKFWMIRCVLKDAED